MKKSFIFFALLFCSFVASATVLRVNNTVGSTAEYTDLASAHGAARNGDTIYMEGSNLPYGSLTVTKRLVIIGPGYFLEENPGTPASLPARLHQIFLNTDSSEDPQSGAAGSEVRGLTFNEFSSSTVFINVSNTLIAQNYLQDSPFIDRVADNLLSNTTITGNFCVDFGVTYYSSNDGIINLLFTNNIVARGFYLPDNSSGSVEHNLFLGDGFRAINFNGQIRSNIATTLDTDDYEVNTTGAGNTSHNTIANGEFGQENNNNIATAADLFIGETGNSSDGRYQLRNDSDAALGTAHDGTDRGPFGGSMPYVLSGLPDIPVILFLQVPSLVRPDATLTTTVEAASGN